MVEGRLNLEPEVREIFQSIDNGRNFLLSGGAGSGKTYSLVNVIRQAIAENPTAKVACMTYTNAAVKEIEERVNHKNLNVSTIHDFLWDSIKHFQKELKEALIALANNEEVTRISIEEVNPVPENYYAVLPDGVQYKEFVRIREGIISHDELLIVANYLFEKYPKLSSIVKDKYKFIFIDEYQDTSKAVVETFLTHFKKSKRTNIIGFFGDAMQSIYEDGIGNLDDYKGDDAEKVNEIPKKQNRRNPQLVIDLANKLRTDGIIQEPSADPKAPNMVGGVIKQGTVLFLHSTDGYINKVEAFLEANYAWDFNNSKETKELNLTHNLIAGKAGFRNLMDIYDKDHILSFRDRIKKYIKDNNVAADFSENTFGEVIEALQQGKGGRELNAVRPTNTMQVFIDGNAELYNYAKSLKYSEFSKMYVDKDQLLDDKKQDKDDENKKGSKRDNLVKHLFKIQNNISLYQNKKYNEFLRATDYHFKITSIASKKALKENIESLVNVGDNTIEQVINDANEKRICLIDDKLIAFKENKEYLYNRVKDVKFSEFQKLYEYLEGQTPFSTQHKTKGTEFDNVLVILDNGGWNNYNFGNLFLGTGSASVLDRTQKIFYVCCTRAKENLTVFFHNPDADVIAKAKVWFGEDNVIDIS
ncbi:MULTISPECIES: UvrD-helicase domain-containing protein [Flavobacteriales]|jgi:DNA helicase-2/ATP-dependent DNA helicase PcrA|uniref:UvrD-helicase domain-containing protein n=1 Tax=Bacteroidota TaxID=976 RepID=UPI00099B03F2|nr:MULTISPECIES: UvrD-helicase domain-containing protein [Weeksellaceae]MBF6645391.1 ATP-dependent helicase [Chryseobacterium indologenes]MBU3048824.1 AAA family ATPase [Chryseobacterium indologenes]OPC11471.1 DNA/RNA helicase [Elizabethkingia miricola]QQQ70944.1 ATP-dependent helicase [Chryseobacterium indologenes]